LAQVLDYQGKGAEAEATFREALALQRELAANNYPVLADLLNAFANVLIEEGSSVEAESVIPQLLT
jgi:hypothetical protein